MGTTHHSARFVGRPHELATMRAALDDARAGRGRVILVSGEPGIGKSRLAAELAEQARDLGVDALWGRAWEGGGAPAFWPWVEVLRERTARVDDATLARELGSGAADLAALIPDIRARVTGLPTRALADDSARFALFDATARFLREASATRPLLLLLEDLHVADESTLLLLRFVAPRVADASVMILATYREGEAHRAPHVRDTLSELLPIALHLPLAGLDEAAVRELVGDMLEGDVDTTARTVHARTEGNPFFVGEVLRLLQSDRGPLRIPPTVREVIRRRLRALGDDALRLLGAASVAGREFDPVLVALVADVAPSEATQFLRDAADAALVNPAETERWRFAHALVQETLYDELSASRRIELHRGYAAAIEERYAADITPWLSQLAHHYLKTAATGSSEKAVEFARLAGRDALDRLAYEEAARHFESALDASRLGSQIEPVLQASLLTDLGRALNRMGQVARAREVLRDAFVTAREAEAVEELAEAALEIARYVNTRSGVMDEEAARLLDDAIAAVGDSDSRIRALLLSRHAIVTYWSDNEEQRDRYTSEALAIAREAGDDRVLGQVLIARQHGLTSTPEGAEERLQVVAQALRCAEANDDRELALEARVWRVMSLQDIGDRARLDVEIEAFARAAEGLGQPLYRWYSAMFRAATAFFCDGDGDRGFQLAGEALALTEELGWAEGPWLARGVMGTYLTILQDPAVAENVIPVYEELARQNPTVMGARLGLGRLYIDVGRIDDARTTFEFFAHDDFAIAPRNRLRLFSMFFAGQIAALLGDRPRAEFLYRELLQFEPWCVSFGRGTAQLGPTGRALGPLAALLGDYAAAEQHFERALQMCSRLGSRAYLAHTQRDFAHMLATRSAPGDAQRAHDLLSRAKSAFEAMGWTALTTKTAAEIEALEQGGRPSRLASATGPSSPSNATAARAVTLRKEGDFWSVHRGERSFRLKDVKGLRYLTQLVREPNREIHALDLMATTTPSGDTLRPSGGRSPLAEETNLTVSTGQGDEILDQQARATYQARLRDLAEEIAEAEAFADTERASKLREEMQQLTDALSAGLGLGGRTRRTAFHAERARQNVTRALRSAIERIAANDPELAAHLDAAVETGTFCSYRPRDAAYEWTV